MLAVHGDGRADDSQQDDHPDDRPDDAARGGTLPWETRAWVGGEHRRERYPRYITLHRERRVQRERENLA